MKSILTARHAARKTCISFAGLLALVISIFLSTSADASGVALGATRVIYPQDAKQASIGVANSDQQNSFLVQSWVSDERGNKLPEFVVTPPLFVLKPGKVNTLRMIYNGPALSEDRESVFYLNNKAIPSLDKTAQAGNSLQIATQSVIKLFVRPAHLNVKSAEAAAMLRCQSNGKNITVTNPSPYFVTLVNINVAGKKQQNMMVPPKGSQTINAAGAVSYQTLNDYGAVTPVLTCKA
ncbi:fimbria/pilus periplasmic chaperone [Enterobacter quasiroggenkampii]|uniref:fimbria/pilus periplasmic chaperone n=1 Tax=Enterobacter quasiroggenkampii TaxID=2497436 RepID=UPI0021D1CD14|nr:fimbria/pilus periplasmic chaperone [Enterobacter quasiroggenkampii]MCU6278859.1 fimbria/pilus periplasmic chaperone [Enterobacter quasiroggenkampii]